MGHRHVDRPVPLRLAAARIFATYRKRRLNWETMSRSRRALLRAAWEDVKDNRPPRVGNQEAVGD